MEPFHFDYWMISLVRWAPVVDPSYPSAITFWVCVIGVPLHFWADPTFRSIRKALGKVEAVNLDEGKVQVIIDGLKPLCFETSVEFHGGEETTVYLRYERLFGYCRTCYSLCHEQQKCPSRQVDTDRNRKEELPEDPKNGKGAISYKNAVAHGSFKEPVKYGGSSSSSNGYYKNKKHGHENREGYEEGRYLRGKGEWKYGEGALKQSRPVSYVHPHELQSRGGTNLTIATKGNSVTEDAEATLVGMNEDPKLGSKVRKNLDFENGEVANNANQSADSEAGKVLMDAAENGQGLEANEESVHDWEKLLANDDTLMDFEIDGAVAGNFEDNTIEQEHQMQLTSEAVKELLEQEDGELLTTGEESNTEVEETAIGEIGTKEKDENMETQMVLTGENEGNKQGTKKKVAKSNTTIIGGNTKKRMVQALISPRKRQSVKGPSNPKLGQKGTKSRVIDEDT
ncbi:uncharacterized protein LOC112083121 [Eutrema salsugineum]|uniref:uncharacterized protein LOC112083121 n=1 Tax=Eutrema salsugineum TaxID=72664 RepID=UPI000CED4E97|nr:uncharacterized protein LOC112083121 [Eutrema salsugineum]